MSVTERVEKAIDISGVGRRTRALIVSLRERRASMHWTNVFGVVSIASVVVLFVTGGILMLFYVPSSDTVVYRGVFSPLRGAEMSKAFASVLGLSTEVRGGLLLRQAHHWAALLLPASIIGQLLVTFFTGAFRRPRQWMWVLLFAALIMALAAGWSGYALPDDMLSGTGLRIVQGIMLGIPIVGTWAAALLFGGEFPGRIVEHIFPIHLIVSVLLVVAIAARIRSSWALGPQHFAGRATALFSRAARRASWQFVGVCVVVVVVSATVTVSPIWTYGPSDPGNVSAGSQPDWYTGFLDGALRLVPAGWEITIFGGTLTLAVLAPLAVVGAFLGMVLLYPFVENWVRRGVGSRDPALLDRPRNVPTRTAIGVAGMTFYGVLWGAASSDVLSTRFGVSLEGVLTTFQVLLFVGPVIAFSVTRRVCIGLMRKDRDLLAHGYETGRIVRMPGGEYLEKHSPVSAGERRELADSGYAALILRPRADGRITITDRVRAAASRLLFRDSSAPVSKELEAEVLADTVDR